MTRTFLHTLIVLTALALQLYAAGDALTWSNPILLQRADPHVVLHSDGWYYFTATVPEYDRIELRRARTLGALASADSKVVWSKHESGPMSHHIWAPEIHFIDGKWETPNRCINVDCRSKIFNPEKHTAKTAFY